MGKDKEAVIPHWQLPYWERKKTLIDSMVGKTFNSVRALNYDGKDVAALADFIVFTSESGEKFTFCHEQDCCECVSVDDIAGDLKDLVGSPILSAEEVSGEIPDVEHKEDSFTYTFYKFATRKGSVTIRWLGESNGYYSEEVDVLYETAAEANQKQIKEYVEQWAKTRRL